MENPHFNNISIKKPIIRKLGTIKCDVVEATPIVFHDRLYRLEYFREQRQNEANDSDMTYMHFIDVYTNSLTSPFAYGHHFGTAFVNGDYMYVAASMYVDNKCPDPGLINVFRSDDLENWELYGKLELPGLNTFNTGICEKDGIYTMLIEVDKPVGFTFRFAQSENMKDWTLLPLEKHFQDGRYAGGPAIYTLPDDPYYYVLYLEAYPEYRFANCIARSTDLIKWEYSPINPVLMYDEYEDKKIASPFLTVHERLRIDRALDTNNSDMELCEFLGRTIIYYSWGNQRGNEYLAEAAYEGSMKDLLQGFFTNN